MCLCQRSCPQITPTFEELLELVELRRWLLVWLSRCSQEKPICRCPYAIFPSLTCHTECDPKSREGIFRNEGEIKTFQMKKNHKRIGHHQTNPKRMLKELLKKKKQKVNDKRKIVGKSGRKKEHNK